MELGEGAAPAAPAAPASGHTPGHLHLTSQTVATAPSDRARTSIGVGERVRLTTTGATGSLSWSITGSSTLSATSGANVTLTAQERSETATVKATDSCGCNLSLTFQVVEPSGVVAERASGTGVWHDQGIPSVGMETSIYITPTAVSFENIDISEDDCVAIVTGYFAGSRLAGIHHAGHGAGSWASVGALVVGKGSKVNGQDTVQSGHCDFGTPYAPGTFDWPIPWLFRVAGGSSKTFATAIHHMTIDASGGMTISKSGAFASAGMNDPTSSY